LQRDRERHDRRRRLRRRRLRHRSAGRSRAPRPADRPRPDPVPTASPHGHEQVALLARGRRSSPAPAAAVPARRDCAPGRPAPPTELRSHARCPPPNTRTPQSNPSRVAKMPTDFPSTSEPAPVAGVFPPGRRAQAKRALATLETRAAARGIAHPPFAVNPGEDGRSLAIELPLTGNGNNAASRDDVSVLRDQLIPSTLGQIPGVQTAVTGTVAEDVDFTHQVKHGMPYVIAFVLGLAFVLLLVTFRSIVVPLKAIALNLLSVAAAYGVLVLVFQHHWAEELLGFNSNGSIISYAVFCLKKKKISVELLTNPHTSSHCIQHRIPSH